MESCVRFDSLKGTLFCILILLLTTVEDVTNKVFRLSPLYSDLKSKDNPLKYVVVGNVVECSRTCEREPACGRFIYDDNNDFCFLYNSSFNEFFFENHLGAKAYDVPSDIQSDCYDVMINGGSSNGIYEIIPRDNKGPINVTCEITSEDGGWLIIQRRTDGSVDFFRTWNEYRDGFGDLNNEFWLGNTNIHRLTTQGFYDLRVELEDWDGSSVFAVYQNFSIASEQSHFQLHVGQYFGNAGDALYSHNHRNFSTKDRNLGSWDCANTCKGAWWYAECHVSNLNGLYLRGNHSKPIGFTWSPYRGWGHSLKTSVMKIRPRPRMIV